MEEDNDTDDDVQTLSASTPATKNTGHREKKKKTKEGGNADSSAVFISYLQEEGRVHVSEDKITSERV